MKAQSSLQAQSSYSNVNGSAVHTSVTPLSSFVPFNDIACVYACSLNSDRAMAVVVVNSTNVCSLYSSLAYSMLAPSSNTKIYVRQINGYVVVLLDFENKRYIFNWYTRRSYPKLIATNGLINYWPVVNGSMIDTAGGVSTSSSSPTFIADWFGNANGAILVNNATNHWTLPSGVYLVGEFSVTGWVINFSCNMSNWFSEQISF